MAYCEIAVSPVHYYWRYHSFALSHKVQTEPRIICAGIYPMWCSHIISVHCSIHIPPTGHAAHVKNMFLVSKQIYCKIYWKYRIISLKSIVAMHSAWGTWLFKCLVLLQGIYGWLNARLVDSSVSALKLLLSFAEPLICIFHMYIWTFRYFTFIWPWFIPFSTIW